MPHAASVGQAIAEFAFDADVVRSLLPDDRGAWLERIAGIQHRRQHVVLDLDQRGGVARGGWCLGNHDGDGFADVADAFAGQRQVRVIERRAAVKAPKAGMSWRTVSAGTGACWMPTQPSAR